MYQMHARMCHSNTWGNCQSNKPIQGVLDLTRRTVEMLNKDTSIEFNCVLATIYLEETT